MSNSIDFAKKNKQKFLAELFELLSIPSVSADAHYRDDVFEAANYIKQKLKEAGCDETLICPTKGYPVIYGEKMIAAHLPTVLVYGHYDVQPADPFDLWKTPPFEPVIREEKIYARGACDDKGQMYMHIKAFEAMMKTDSLPCNVKFMIEGEEEVGSPNLGTFIKENKERLEADFILISDTSMLSLETPTITTGLRGLSYMEVEVIGPNRDLHSGVYGGAVANPINVLVKMIASLQDENHKISIPNFYDDVVELSEKERNELAQVPFDVLAYKNELSIEDIQGEKGFSTIERTSIRPTLDVNGIWGGYIGEGAKTVLPQKACAKISMRLVPNQDNIKISRLFEQYFLSIAPPSVQVKVTTHHGGKPVVTPTDSLPYLAAEKAILDIFQKKPLPLRSGGSIPIVALFEEILGLKSLLLGFGLDTDALHSPNEHFGLKNFYLGIDTILRFYEHYTELYLSSKNKAPQKHEH